LPLRRDLQSIAVIGTDATEGRRGGYSGRGIRTTSVLDGIRAAAGSARVRYAPGPGRLAPTHIVIPAANLGTGLRGEYFANNRLEGEPHLVRTDPQVDFGWTLSSPARGIPFDWYSVRWTGAITAPEGG